MRALTTVACVICALAALLLAFFAYWDWALTGFPDSHLTDYDKAAEPLKVILVWIEGGLSLLFLVLIGFGVRARAVGLLMGLITLVVIVIVERIGIPWYFKDHLHLDNGVGG